MTWFDSVKRWLGVTKPPAPTSGVTSILFVLQSARGPMTFAAIQEQTTIREDDLAKVMEVLKLEGRIRVDHMRIDDHTQKVYSIIYPSR